jgi:1,4-alpha-glucan branching enzyme
MGCEFGQSAEWNFEGSLDWHLNEYPYHDGVRKLITDLNGCIRRSRHYMKSNLVPKEWINYSDHQMQPHIRKGVKLKDDVLWFVFYPSNS